MKSHYDVLIIGGGTAGIMVAAQLKRRNKALKIGLIEPAETHYYQPAWTLVGAGTYDYKKTARPMSSVMPSDIDWIKDYASGFNPEENSVSTKNSGNITYKYLVVSPGLVYDFSLVKGLAECIDKGVVCSNYTNPNHTWKVIQNFKGGVALFTQPATPIKCGGAPQKIMYLAENHFRKSGVIDKTDIVFATPGSVIFAVPEIKKTLMEVVDRKDINLRFFHKLVEIDSKNKIAWYEITRDVDAGGCVVIEGTKDEKLDHNIQYNYKDVKVTVNGDRYGIHYDMLHLAPPQTAPKFIQESTLVNDAKWLDVNHQTMQHNKYTNIFGLGDVAALPTAKTGAAIRKQVPIVVDNVLMLLEHDKIGSKSYNGYSSCPLVTDYGKMALAEFDYDNNFTPDPKLKQMFISDSSKEHWRLWMLKKYMLPYLYWNKMMKGDEV